MLTYSRWAPLESVLRTERHVAAHLSSVADPDDSSTAFLAEVHITHTQQDGGVLITGELEREAAAPYLLPGFDPEQDVADNPLTVASIEDRQ